MSLAGSASRIESLDGLRGFAVLIVFLMHTIGKPGGGELGVDLFFALSGFLITSQLLAEVERTGGLRLGHFYWKRCKRLIPAFAAVCVLYSAIHLCFPRSAAAADPLTMLSLLLIANFHWANGVQPVPFLQHTWSLAVEWQFYLVWPLLLVAGFKLGMRRRALLASLLVAVLLVWAARWRGNLYLRFDGILLGSMIPMVIGHRRVRKLFGARLALALLFALPVLLLLAMVGYPLPALHTFSRPATSALGCVIILFVLLNRSALSEALLSGRLLRRLGEISYALYLYHFPIAALMYVNGFTPVQMLVVGLLVSLPLAEVSWRYLEEPILRRRSMPRDVASVAPA